MGTSIHGIIGAHNSMIMLESFGRKRNKARKGKGAPSEAREIQIARRTPHSILKTFSKLEG